MYTFTPRQKAVALLWLSLFHILIITSSNYLVQLPISIFGFHTTWEPLLFRLFS
ncbi:Inner membrane protein yhhQ [Proteus vulgaris]|nr:Inner membrane protein yhhQ [Proteus vulgaris]